MGKGRWKRKEKWAGRGTISTSMFKLSEVADNHVQATVEHTVKKFTYCACVQAPNDDDDSETFDFHSVLYSCTVLCPVPKHTMKKLDLSKQAMIDTANGNGSSWLTSVKEVIRSEPHIGKEVIRS